MCKITKNLRRVIIVIEITKNEAVKLREACPYVFIAKTKRKYLVEEIPSVLKNLNKIRSKMTIICKYPNNTK